MRIRTTKLSEGDDKNPCIASPKRPTGIVDHYALAIDEFDRESVTRTLAQLGLTPEQNLDYGFYVRDPEGIPVQIVGT